MPRFTIGVLSVLCLLAGCGPAVRVRPSPEPQVQVLVSKAKIQPGHALRITAWNETVGLALQVSGWDQTIALAPVVGERGRQEGFLAVPLEARTGPMDLIITSAGPNGRPFLSLPIEVLARPPDPISRLTIKNFGRLPYAQESRILAEVRQKAGNYPGPRLEPWTWPVAGRISERFGVRRIYNRGLGSWPHGGYDIAAAGGTPILAPANGQVIFTAPFQAHGNTVLIDHGYGVITTYLHLRTIYLKAGDEVRPGQAIGEVGSTGGSTADHLHFQVNVNGRVAEPEDFLQPEK